MRRLLILVLFFVSIAALHSCESICSSLYNNPDWADHSTIRDTEFTVPVDTGSVTGIITASFETFRSTKYVDGNDFLRFIKSTDNEKYQPLFFRFDKDKPNLLIRGRRGSKPVGDTTLESIKNITSIQISDKPPNNYTILLGYAVTTRRLDYNYKSNSEWTQFKINNVLFKDTARIKSDGRFTVYKYISACSDSTPRLCDAEKIVTENVTLDSSYTLTCTGSGAPYLDVKWTKDGNPTEVTTSDVTTTDADHKIVSTIDIDKINIDHLGEWNCTIYNKNFRDSVTKTYILQYSHQVSLNSSPTDFYSNSSGKDTVFQWVVKGWPLQQVTLDCGDVNLIENKSGYYDYIPPQVLFKLTLRNEDEVNCTLKDGENVLDTRQITRVGYNCVAGEDGVGKECKVCGPGQTSLAGIGECFAANSSCTEGYWGTDKNCYECPENKTSFPETVKMQECFPDVSNCTEGRYGYGNNCSLCPTGETSHLGTKKVTGCFPDVSNCTEGQYGYGNYCSLCPTGETSHLGTKKKSGCFPDVSYCTVGQYGYGNNCSLCPTGETSEPGTKKKTGCFAPPTESPQLGPNLLAPIGGGAGGLVAILIFAGVFCFVLRRKKAISAPIKSRLVENTENSLVHSNDPATEHIPSLPYELKDSECAYAVITSKNRDTQSQATKSSHPCSDISDGTYSVLNRDSQKKISHGTRIQEQKATDVSKHPRQTTSFAGSSPEMTEDIQYANLDEVKRVRSSVKDKKADEGSTYSCVQRPGTEQRGYKTRRVESDVGDVVIDEDPLYADMDDRNPIAFSEIPVNITGNGKREFKSSIISGLIVDGQDDTYASVELSTTSRLRTKQTAELEQKERAEYCTILEFQRRKSYEEEHVDLENENG